METRDRRHGQHTQQVPDALPHQQRPATGRAELSIQLGTYPVHAAVSSNRISPEEVSVRSFVQNHQVDEGERRGTMALPYQTP